ncbi:MAG: iron complex transport system substrate-binding protein [Candidatus Nanohaloarchaea archaeon]|jgi:iron complex transport system substrate-binding protein
MKIVSLAPSNTEILYRLGAEDFIVATTSLCDYPEEAIEKPSVGGWTDSDLEKIEEIEPDLALASDDLQDEIVENLEEKNIEVVQVKPHSLEEVFESIELLGRVVGKEQEASKLVKNMKKQIETVDLEGARIYCEEWMDPPMISGNWIPDLIQEAGGNYFIDRGRSREFKTGKLRKFDPEYIFLNVCGAGENIDTSKVLERDKWREIQAVREKNVYILDDALLNRPGPRLVKGLKEIERRVKN